MASPCDCGVVGVEVVAGAEPQHAGAVGAAEDDRIAAHGEAQAAAQAEPDELKRVEVAAVDGAGVGHGGVRARDLPPRAGVVALDQILKVVVMAARMVAGVHGNSSPALCPTSCANKNLPLLHSRILPDPPCFFYRHPGFVVHF